MSVLSSGCELDGTVHNVSQDYLDGCQTCTCKVSIGQMSTLTQVRVSSLNKLICVIANRGVRGSATPSPALHWTAHSWRLYLETAASDVKVNQYTTINGLMQCVNINNAC